MPTNAVCLQARSGKRRTRNVDERNNDVTHTRVAWVKHARLSSRHLPRCHARYRALTGCAPQAPLEVEHHDLETLDLTNCPSPTVLSIYTPSYANLAPGAYWMRHDRTIPGTFTTFDVPPGHSITVLTTFDLDQNEPASYIHVWDLHRLGYSLHDATDHDIWIYLDTRQADDERSHYTVCVYDCRGKASPAALLEQLAASVSRSRYR